MTLASDPNATHLTARRNFYERTNKNFSKLEKSKENSEYYESFQSNPNKILTDGGISSNNYNNNNNNKNTNSTNNTTESLIHSKLSHYFNNEEVVVDLLDNSVSPASIHRKNSYRRAQEHKLFFEMNNNNPNVRMLRNRLLF